jgi:hypothetical protein
MNCQKCGKKLQGVYIYSSDAQNIVKLENTMICKPCKLLHTIKTEVS